MPNTANTKAPAHHMLSEEALRAMQRLLLTRSQPYALQQLDGSYRWVYAPCERETFAAHLAGALTLALSSTDARGWCRWLCLDADAEDALPQLVVLRAALAERGLPGQLEASRRGGHLWLFFDEPLPAVAARFALLQALDEIASQWVAAGQALPSVVPQLEVFPDTSAAGALGHAVRLPLGVHRRTELRYPLLDEAGQPFPGDLDDLDAQLAALLAAPRVASVHIRAQWERFGDAERGRSSARRDRPHAHPVAHSIAHPVALGDALTTHQLVTGGRIGTRSPVIRWVDAEVSPLELLAALAPGCELRPVGQGYLGWCPFHDDQASDADGTPGTPSLYVVRNQRFGWSWRCLSTNCVEHDGAMRHSFRLFAALLGLDARTAILAARERWPELAAVANEADERESTDDREDDQDPAGGRR